MKSIFLITIVLIFTLNLWAEPVEYDKALDVAHNWLEHQNRQREISTGLSVKESYMHRIDDHIIFYVFNFDPEGFVIVAGDDASVPILGYNYRGTTSLQEIPHNAASFFRLYELNMLDIYENRLSNEATIGVWQSILNSDIPVYRNERRVDPLLTSKWNQNYPWNRYCPQDNVGPGQRAYAGCVAVAMGQIMKYWHHPRKGTGSHSYVHETYGRISADFGETTYHWEYMLDEQATYAAAELLFHLGVAVEMDYGSDGSGAYSTWVANALAQYFDYSGDAEYIGRVDSDNWVYSLKEQLDNNLPMYYSGRKETEITGHAFNCDGYDENDNFHFNWGWGGLYDGFYHIDNLNPGSHDYTDIQAAIFDLRPGYSTDVVVPGTGDGTIDNPYRISSLQDLYWIAADHSRWGYHYIQTADINAIATRLRGDGQGWKPIGYYNDEHDFEAFTGTYDGQNHVIDRLYINRPYADFQGLFGYTFGSTVSNLGVTNVDITGRDSVGGLLGINYCFSTVNNCFSTGKVKGNEGVGGLTGNNTVATINNSYNKANVTSTGYCGGGLVGLMVSSTVSNSYNNGTVNGHDTAGGLIGANYKSTVTNSYSTGNVDGSWAVGGLIGFDLMSEIINSYSTGKVTGESQTGGLIGDRFNTTVTNSYWDTETSGQSSSAGGFGRTTAEMTSPHSENTYIGWDFTNVWKADINLFFNDGYPYLKSLRVHPSPSDLSAVIDEGVINLNWQAPQVERLLSIRNKSTNISTYREMIGYDLYRNNEVINTDLIIETNYADFEIENGESYYYFVKAVYEDGKSEPSNAVIVNPNFPLAASPLEGDGSLSDPYQIADLANLRWVSENHAGEGNYYTQTADIDASVTRKWYFGNGWSPIGTGEEPFRGSYDGQSFKIDGLYINRNNRSNIGLFGVTTNANIRDLGLTNAFINGMSNVGGLIGYSERCTILNCYFSGDVSGDYSHIGGLVGLNNSVLIRTGYSIGSVKGRWNVGGLIGKNSEYNHNIVSNCYSMSSVRGVERVGGLIGWHYSGNVEKSYSTGTVIGDDYVGGLIGEGGYGNIEHNYWNTETSGQTSSDGGEGRTTAEMTYPYADNTYTNWNFVSVWIADEEHDVNFGYPYLVEVPLQIKDTVTPVVEQISLYNYPNPFNPETKIIYHLQKDVEILDLKIYNIRGQLVRVLVAATPHSKGEYRVVWDGRNDSGTPVTSGVYFCRITIPGKDKATRMLLLK